MPRFNRDTADDGLREERYSEFVERRPLPKPPSRFLVEGTDAGVRCTVINDGPQGRLNGAVRYDVYWSKEVDTTTVAGKAAGFARAVCLAPSIPATQVEGSPSSALYNDPSYRTGYFFCCGVDAHGRRSEPSEPAQATEGTGAGLLPDNVRHLQISESGETANDTVFSALSVTCMPPVDTSNFGGVQIYLKDYLRVGDVQEGYFHQWLGGGINFKVLYPIARRKGSAAVAVTNGSPTITGTGLLALFQANDLFEAMGVRGTVQSVTDTAITLTANWAGPTNASLTEYAAIGYVTIFAVSLSKTRGRRSDITGCPSKAMLMDGELSAPNAPVLSVSNIGNRIRLEWDQVAGTNIKRYFIYRTEGIEPDISFADATQIGQPVDHDSGSLNASTRRHFEDSDFTIYQREHGIEFTYYAVTENVRGERSAPSAGVEGIPRLDSGDDTTVGRRTEKNLFWNGHIMGTNAGQVLSGDTNQDVGMGGGAPTSGHYRWVGGNSGGVDLPGHQYDTEVILPFQGAGQSCYIEQRIDAWASAITATTQPRIDKNSYYVFSIYAYASGGTPNGTLNLWIDQFTSGGVPAGRMLLRERLSDDTFGETEVALVYAANQLADNDVVRIYGVFKPNPGAGTIAYIVPRITFADGTNGVNIIVLRAMFSLGTEPSIWTPELMTSTIRFPPPGGGTPDFRDDHEDGGHKRRAIDV